jgi:PKD repeat protein
VTDRSNLARRRAVRGAVIAMATVLAGSVWLGACGGQGTSTGSSGSSSTPGGTAPTAAFSFTPSTPSAGLAVQFTDASTGTPTAWSWTFGDGGTSTTQSPSHTFASAGTYTVTLTATNASGVSTKSQTITVSAASGRTIGLMVTSSAAYDGYTLFAPKQNTMTYLINNEGRLLHQWTASKFPPGQSVYLLENGHLLRTCMTKGKLSAGGGEGGRVEEYDWEGNLVWQLDYSTDTYMQHHDVHILPNGNLLMVVMEKKTYAEVMAAGFSPSKLHPDVAARDMMLPDSVVEIQPTRPVGGKVVWEWHVWDHLVQDYDSTKSNYGDVAAHPELIGTGGDGKNLPVFWNHVNSIDYNPDLDQIALSVRGNSEVWIIDHSTTTAEAARHTGGRRGKGGDLLYRWGNPLTYRAGTAADQRYYQQHDVEWVPPGYPGAGNLTCFNNGLGRGVYSTVDEFEPAIDSHGDYPTTRGSAFGPKDLLWSYRGGASDPMYSENISGAHRLPNGNTIMCSGTVGEFREVNAVGTVVWKYICPVDATGPLTQGTKPPNDPARPLELMNSVFRVYKYSPTYPAFNGRTLAPGDFIERY